MKSIITSLVIIYCSLTAVAQSNYVHQIIVLNEGRHDYVTSQQIFPVTIGSIDPSTFLYTGFDTIHNVRFASDVFVADQFIYVAADSFLIQYDKITLQKIQSVIVPGIRKIAIWNNQVLVSKGEYLKQFNSYIEVYDGTNLNFIYALDTIAGPAYATEDIIVMNNTAYVAVGNGFEWGNEKDIIGSIDLNTQTYFNEIHLGLNATNPENMMLYNNKIYTLNNQDYSTASISEYDIASGVVTTTDLLTPTGCAASAFANTFVYFQVAGDNKVQRFSTASLSTFDTLNISKNLYGIIHDNINNVIYAGHTDFTSYGKIYKITTSGSLIDSVDVNVSPGNIALDVRIGSGIDSYTNSNFISTYPNPSIDKIELNIDQKLSSKAQIEVYNLAGAQVSLPLIVNNKNIQLNISGLDTGIYFISIVDENRVYTSRFIKE